jgi:protein-disulfide isomerase
MTRISPALACAAALLAATLATTACGQTQAGAAPRAPALAPADADSLRARADRGRTRGADTARVTIIEVSDFQCPFCAEFARETYPALDSAYIATGRARMVYIHLPLSSHAQAFRAAEASMCAGEQGRFWEMHDRIFATQREWSRAPDAVERFESMAGETGVDLPRYRECMANGHTASLVVGDAMQAAGAGISGTPSFILNAPGGQRMLTGAVPFEQFAREIDALLASPVQGPE